MSQDVVLVAGASVSTYYLLCTHPGPCEISSLSLHDALPISPAHGARPAPWRSPPGSRSARGRTGPVALAPWRSEEHTSELQSRGHLVWRLLLEWKNAGSMLARAALAARRGQCQLCVAAGRLI